MSVPVTLRADGSLKRIDDDIAVPANISLPDGVASVGELRLGDGDDLKIYHTGTDSYIDQEHATADLYIRTGSPLATAFRVTDGGVTQFYEDTQLLNGAKTYFGSNSVATIYHSTTDGTDGHAYLKNDVGDFYFLNESTGTIRIRTGATLADALLIDQNQHAEFKQVVGIGATPLDHISLKIYKNPTDPTVTEYGQTIEVRGERTSGTASTLYGMFLEPSIDPSNTSDWAGVFGLGVQPRAYNASSGTLTEVNAVKLFDFNKDTSTCTVTNYRALYIHSQTEGTNGTYGIYIEAPGGSATTKRAIHVAGGECYFGGTIYTAGGSQSSPAIQIDDLDSGLYKDGAGRPSMSVNNNQIMAWAQTEAKCLKPLDMTSNKITDLLAGTASTDAVNKAQLDAMAQGVNWRDPVISKDETTAPGSPSTGDRYIMAGNGGDWSGGSTNDIAEWDSAAWLFSTPEEGDSVWNQEDDEQLIWNGSSWAKFGSTITHANLALLNADDHTHYTLAAGTRAFSGNQSFGGNDITSVANIESTTGSLILKGGTTTALTLAGADVTHGGSSYHPSGVINLGANNALQFGTAKAQIRWDESMTVDSTVFALDDTNAGLILTTQSNKAYDHNYGTDADPRLLIASSAADSTNYLELKHNTIVSAGTSLTITGPTLSLATSGGTAIQLSAGGTASFQGSADMFSGVFRMGNNGSFIWGDGDSPTGTGDALDFDDVDTVTLTDAGGTFTAAMVGKTITISGATGSNNGSFPVTAVNSGTELEYTNASGADETIALTWALNQFDEESRLDWSTSQSYDCMVWGLGSDAGTGSTPALILTEAANRDSNHAYSYNASPTLFLAHETNFTTDYLYARHDEIDCVGSNFSIKTGGTTALIFGSTSQNATFSADVSIEASLPSLYFKEVSVAKAQIAYHTTNHQLIISTLADDDNAGILFKTDGVDALTLDASQNAEFYGHVDITDNLKIRLGSGQDCEIYHSGSDAYINNTTGNLKLLSDALVEYQCGNSDRHQFTANAAYAHTSGTKYFAQFQATHTAADTSGLTRFLAVEPTINITGTSTGGYQAFYMNVLETSHTGNTSQLMVLAANSVNQFVVDSAGSLTLKGNVSIADDNSALFGDNHDLRINYQSGAGHCYFSAYSDTAGFVFNLGSATAPTEAFRIASDKTVTFAGHAYILDSAAGSNRLIIGTGGDFNLFHDGSDNYIDSVGTAKTRFRMDNGATLVMDMAPSTGLTTFYKDVSLVEDQKLYFDSDLKTYIKQTVDANRSTTDLILYAEGDHVLQGAGNQYFWITTSGSANVRIDRSNTSSYGHLQFSTAQYGEASPQADWTIGFNETGNSDFGLTGSSGAVLVASGRDVTLYGNISLTDADSQQLIFGAGSDLKLYHDGASRIESHDGNFYIDNQAATRVISFRTGVGSSPVLVLADGGSAQFYGKVQLYENEYLYFDDDNTTSIRQTDAGDLAINTSAQLDLNIDHASVGDMSNTGTNHFWRVGKNFGDVTAGGYYVNQSYGYYHSTTASQSIQCHGYHATIIVQAENTTDHTSVGARCFSGIVQTSDGGSGSIAGCAVFYAQNAAPHATGTIIKDQYGVYIEGMTAGDEDNYGLYIGTPSGGSATNRAIHVAGGDSYFGGHIKMLAGQSIFPRNGDNDTYITSTAANTIDFYAGGITLQLASGAATLSGALSMGTTNKITDLADGTIAGDALTYGQAGSFASLAMASAGMEISDSLISVYSEAWGATRFKTHVNVNKEYDNLDSSIGDGFMYAGAVLSPIGDETVQVSNGYAFCGLVSVPTIGADNTQNWTQDAVDGGLTGIRVIPEIRDGATGTLTTCTGLHIDQVYNGGMTVTDNYGIYVRAHNNSTNTYGIYIASGFTGTAKYPIYVADTNPCYFAGGLESARAIQLTSDTFKLQIGAGQDLQLWHDATDSYVRTSTGSLILQTGGDNDRLAISSAGVATFGGQVGSALETQTNVDTSVTVDLDNGNVHHLTVDGNITTLTVNNPEEGFWYHFVVEQAGTGSYTVSWPAAFKWPGGTAPTLSTAVGAVDVVHGVYVNGEFLMRYDLNHS